MIDPNDALEVRIIDALADAMEEIPELPEHKTVRYKRPVIVIPGEDTPLLAVWLLAKSATPRATESYDSAIMVGISWQDESVERAVTLMDQPEAYKADLKATALLQEKVRSISVHRSLSPLVPEAYNVYPMTVDFLPPISLETGLVEGYAMTVEVDVIESAP